MLRLHYINTFWPSSAPASWPITAHHLSQKSHTGWQAVPLSKKTTADHNVMQHNPPSLPTNINCPDTVLYSRIQIIINPKHPTRTPCQSQSSNQCQTPSTTPLSPIPTPSEKCTLNCPVPFAPSMCLITEVRGAWRRRELLHVWGCCCISVGHWQI